jgi:hypothetical protein
VQPTRVAVAGTAFAAVRQHLEDMLPGAVVEMVPVQSLRQSGCVAEVVIPAMSRIDGEVMDRVDGLRLITSGEPGSTASTWRRRAAAASSSPTFRPVVAATRTPSPSGA